mgnify:CR=1 FL=1
MIGKEVIMSRKSFVLYTEWEDAFDGQPNDIAGELIKAIFDYVRTEEMPQTDNTVVNAMFSIFKPATLFSFLRLSMYTDNWSDGGRIL